MINHPLYLEDIDFTSKLSLPWECLSNKSVLITGAAGMIGSYLIDVLMYKNKSDNLNCTIHALGRNEEKAKKRFVDYWESDFFNFVNHDINLPLNFGQKKVDFILHLASNTHPLAYTNDPIGTITTNIIGTKNLLDFASTHKTKKFIFASSNEIYGENKGDIELFNESYCGYIDCNTLRAGYPESKRCGEALCQAYMRQNMIDVSIARLTRSYGPTVLSSDSKAISQFLEKGIKGENIVLKSNGEQYYSYTYVSDAVFGLLTILLKGKKGEAYNIADEASDIRLKDLARLIADYSNTRVIFELPESAESDGYSKATKSRLSGDKIRQLGWNAKYGINEGVRRCMTIQKFSLE